MLALNAAGFHVAVPFGENARYDLLVDDGRSIGRVQCKTGRLRDGAVWFPTCSSYGHHRNPTSANRSYAGEIDYFGVHCPETDGVYLVPLRDVPTTRVAALRIADARNGQRKRVRLGGDYEVGTVAFRRRLRASAGG